MVCKGLVIAETRVYVKYLAENEKISTREIVEKTSISCATVYQIKAAKAGKKSLTNTTNKGHHAGGRPRKLDSRDERKLIRILNLIRKEEGQFSSKRLMERAGIQFKKAK
jgi:transposase